MTAKEGAFWEYVGLTGWQVLALVVSTSVLFWFFSVLMRAFPTAPVWGLAACRRP